MGPDLPDPGQAGSRCFNFSKTGITVKEIFISLLERLLHLYRFNNDIFYSLISMIIGVLL